MFEKRLTPSLVLAALLALPALARADDDALAPYRERFKAGMERYKGQNFAEAIQYWEPIYREIGPTKGYRLSFDLGKAYDQLGDSTHAAERFESFLAELEARRGAGEKIDAQVDHDEKATQARLDELKATKGRIKVQPGARPMLSQIDTYEPRLGSFVAYVLPGSHVVTFGAGTNDAERHDVVVKAGEVVEVNPKPEPPPPPPPPPPSEATHPGPPPPPRMTHETRHPFSPVILEVAGALTFASLAVPIITFTSASSQLSDIRNTPTPGANNRNAALAYNTAVTSYESARSLAYFSLAIPIGLAAVTTGLMTWYFLGTSEREVITPPAASAFVAPIPGGVAAGVSARF